MLLDDKVILITGSTTGIGAAIARKAVSEGAQVMIHGRCEERAKALADELGSAAAYCIQDLVADGISDELVAATINAFGRIDGLINNAGIYPRNTIDDLEEDFFNRVMHVNLKVPMFQCQHAVRAFRQQKTGGSIVNIGSINAHCGQTDILVYSASKGGLMTMTRNLGDALGAENIRVNQLNVGWTVTETEHALKMGEGFPEDWEHHVPDIFKPAGKLLRPDDIARHAVFWVSDYSAPTNGQVYELEQYPLIGRNLLYTINLDHLKEE